MSLTEDILENTQKDFRNLRSTPSNSLAQLKYQTFFSDDIKGLRFEFSEGVDLSHDLIIRSQTIAKEKWPLRQDIQRYRRVATYRSMDNTERLNAERNKEIEHYIDSLEIHDANP